MATSSIFQAPAPTSNRPASAAPRSAAPTTPDAPPLALKQLVLGKLQLAPKQPTVASTLDARLLAILDAPLAPGETAKTGFARKESELLAVLATLPVLDARTLQARLSRPTTTDVLASTFARLTIERRTRLLSFLADVRRREAIAIARR